MNAFFWLIGCLALTILIEGALAALLFGRWHAVYATLLCNLLTNPLVNLILLFVLRLSPGLYVPALSVLELCVVLGEGLLLRKLLPRPFPRALAVSLLLNAASFGAGLLLNHTIM